MKLSFKALLVGALSVVALSSCTITSTGYGTGAGSSGAARAASMTFVLKCTDVSLPGAPEIPGAPGSPMHGSGHFVFRDSSARVSITGLDVTECGEAFPGAIYVGDYRTATGGHGTYTLNVQPSGPGCPPFCIVSGRTVSTTRALTVGNNSFELSLDGVGPEGGYDLLSSLNGRVSVTYTP
jgi:hypothetical protein